MWSIFILFYYVLGGFVIEWQCEIRALTLSPLHCSLFSLSDGLDCLGSLMHCKIIWGHFFSAEAHTDLEEGRIRGSERKMISYDESIILNAF